MRMSLRVLLFALAWVSCWPPTTAFAQVSKTQQLQGGYAGLTQLGVGVDPSDIRLDILSQDSRSFSGTLSYIEQDNLIVGGTIAASGKCSIVSEPGDLKSNLLLNWQTFGGGGAILTGKVLVAKTTGSVVFVRPFNELGVDWAGQVGGRHSAVVTSSVTRRRSVVPVHIVAGAEGAFRAEFDGWIEPDPAPVVIATSSSDLRFAAAGVDMSPSQIFTLSGQVITDLRTGQPTGLNGSYSIQTPDGKTTDNGIIAILIGIR